ncbi:MAG: hypothetical protein OHK0019_33470 [Saprospiraceae bacterium]
MQNLPPSIEVATDAAGIFAIYPNNGVPPGSEKWNWVEKTIQVPDGAMARNIVVPTVTVFNPAKEKANGTAVIIAPGGAFNFLMMDKEGYNVARWLSKLGVTAFVLKYRVARTPDDDAELQPFLSKLFSVLPRQGPNELDPPVGTPAVEAARLLAEEDGRQAIRFVRTNAAAFGIHPNKIGIMGFSAGGGVAVNAALEHDNLGRPDFVGGIYAGWRKGPTVPDDAPPLFLAISNNDVLVTSNSSSQLYEMWHKAEKPVELHIFGNGEHGFGARQNGALTDAWMPSFENWLVANGFISKSENKLESIFPQGQKGPADNFTGNAYNYPLVLADSTYTTLVGNVYFEPGARTNWHTHPGGQILIITDGVGYYQEEGKPKQVMRKGDVVKCPPNVKHWHGASPDTGLQQMYIVPNTEKGIVKWMERVTDEVYNKE